MPTRALPACLAAFLLAVPAAAYRTTSDASLQTNGGACGGCHTDPGVSPPTITIESDGPYVEGESAFFHITVRSNQGDGAGRFAAFAASTTSAGTFAAGTDYVLVGNPPNNRVRDVERRTFVDGVYAWTVSLSNLRRGNHTLRVGGNDVNGNNLSTGDRGAGATFAFTVEAVEGDAGPGPLEDAGQDPSDAGPRPDGGGGDPPPGCQCAGTASPSDVALGALFALGLLACRRRRGR